jgi:deoxyribodipyrimidine photo-lyase
MYYNESCGILFLKEMVQEERIRELNRNTVRKGRYVLYWMQASQRTEYNHALELAIDRANELQQPLLVYFGLTDAFPEANERHYHFMLEGLKYVREQLRSRGIGMVVERTSPETGVVRFAGEASLVVCDCGYLMVQRRWRRYVAEHVNCPLLQVECEVIVPVEVSSDKEEYSAATLRRKLARIVHRYMAPLEESSPRIDSTRLEYDSYNISDIPRALSALDIDRSVKPVNGFRGGTGEAKKRLAEFIDRKLDRYPELKNDPNEDCVSKLSPYLHFGQISPLYVALEVSRHGGTGRDAFLEELVVRRELSMNFVHYNKRYAYFDGLPGWAQRTLSEHRKDRREYLYSPAELERAQTYDPYWNAAQREMMATGKMHGYMRMYWGKKILEWSANPEEAYTTALSLNNKYELDGRDPNGFTGIAWCFGKHDRLWANRPVFGNIRYMNAAGLKRKFDIEKYARRYG